MNPKQFEKYCWPFYQKLFQDIADHDWCGWLFFEGSVAHIINYLREIPSGHFAMLIEQDDPVWLKKQLPNIFFQSVFRLCASVTSVSPHGR